MLQLQNSLVVHAAEPNDLLFTQQQIAGSLGAQIISALFLRNSFLSFYLFKLPCDRVTACKLTFNVVGRWQMHLESKSGMT